MKTIYKIFAITLMMINILMLTSLFVGNINIYNLYSIKILLLTSLRITFGLILATLIVYIPVRILKNLMKERSWIKNKNGL